MPKMTEIFSTAAIAAVTVGLIFRSDMLRGAVTGVTAAKPDPANPKAARALYV